MEKSSQSKARLLLIKLRNQGALLCVWALIGAIWSPVLAAEDVLVHLWEADSQTIGGKTVNCYVLLTAVAEQEAFTMNLSLFAQSVAPEKIQTFTGIKIRAYRLENGSQEVPIEVHSAWIRSSSGSTVGKLKKLDTHPDPYFLGAAPGMGLFTTLLQGILRDGVSVGFQENSGNFDKVFKIAEPLPDDSKKTLLSCMNDLRSSL